MKTRVCRCLIALLSLSAGAAFGEVQPVEPGPWTYKTVVGVNLSQSSYSANWAGGDEGSFTWVATTDLNASRQFNTGFNLSNQLQLAYGQTASQTREPTGGLTWDAPDKTSDIIMFESTGRFTGRSFADPYFALRLDSQFKDQSSPIGTIDFNPIKLKGSGGLAKMLHKTEDAEALMRLGVGVRQTFAHSFVPSTLEKVASSATDGGMEWQTNVIQPFLNKKLVYKGDLLVFWPLFYSKATELEDFDAAAMAAFPGRESVTDYWRVPDVNFQSTFTSAITKYLSVNLIAHLIYDKFDTAANLDPTQALSDQIAEVDKNVRKAGQFRETLALSLSVRLF